MKDYIDIQERPSWGRMLPLSFQHLFAMFGSTVLVPYLLKVDPVSYTHLSYEPGGVVISIGTSGRLLRSMHTSSSICR